MRELKFRAWDIKRKEMFFVDTMTFRMNNDVYRVWKDVVEPVGGLLINPETGILMQYTGLRDKSNNEIYEGDMLSVITQVGKTFSSKVSFFHNTYTVIFESGKFTFGGYTFDNSAIETIEIVGNIFDNPKGKTE